MSLQHYANTFRPQGLDGTAVEGMEPVLGPSEDRVYAPGEVERRHCFDCARFAVVEDGEAVMPLFFCVEGLLPAYDVHGRHIGERRVFGLSEARAIQTRCLSFERKGDD